MQIIKRNYTPPLRQHQFKIQFMLAICLIMLNGGKTFAQDTLMAYSSTKAASYVNKTLFGGTITNSGYGGIILKFSGFNDKFAFMTGGRGAITINNRCTIGGGGYGIANSIVLTDSCLDTNRYFKMGYGGVESGYIFYTRKKVRIGCSMLIAAGASFLQISPKSDGEKLFDEDFTIFPVFEPSLYGELALNQFMWLHAGISYRYIHHANLDYMSDQCMRGFSFYIGLLFGNSE